MNTSSLLEYFILENGINGLIINATSGSIPVNLSYGIIRNFSQNGISVNNTDLIAHDLLVTNCGQACINLEGDADYAIYQSTFYNSWSFSQRTDPSLIYQGTGEASLHISNSIIWGGRNNELELQPRVNTSITNSLLKLGSTSQEEYAIVFENCLFNENPLFMDLDELDFGLQADSPAIDKGNLELNMDNWLDLNNNRRDLDEAPDMGAYEYVEMN